MNLPPDEYILVPEAAELAFIKACFEWVGLAEKHAALISRLLTNSDLRGVRSHGIGYAPGYVRDFKEGNLNRAADIRVVSENTTTVVVDGDGSLGYVPMVRATELAIARARDVGVGMGLVRHIGHYGAAGHYTRMCAEAGCIGYSVQGFRGDGKRDQDPRPSVAFTGAPPISFALPGGEEPDIVLDMVAHALSGYSGEEYEDLPARIPAAFFKSMGLVATAILMGGGLAGTSLPEAGAVVEKWPAARAGGLLLAIDVASAVDAAAFGAETDRYIRDIQSSFAPLPGYDRVLLPGGVEEEILRLHRAEGVRFGAREQNVAQALHEYTGVPLPWEE